MTAGRLPKEASIRLSITLATALTGESTTSMVFRDMSDAEKGAVELAGSSTSNVVEQYQSAARLQNMTGQVWRTVPSVDSHPFCLSALEMRLHLSHANVY